MVGGEDLLVGSENGGEATMVGWRRLWGGNDFGEGRIYLSAPKMVVWQRWWGGDNCGVTMMVGREDLFVGSENGGEAAMVGWQRLWGGNNGGRGIGST